MKLARDAWQWWVGGDRGVKRLGAALTDALYPRLCAGCGRRGTWVCDDCDAGLPRFAEPWCPGCGIPPGVGACRCDARSVNLGAVRSVGPFAGWLRAAIIDLKYHDEWARAAHLGAVLAPVLDAMGEVDAIVPVPLHPARLRQRGYNQAALLAAEAGQLLGLPMIDVLRRVRPTPQQVGLSAAERRRNVDGAFSLDADQHVSGLRVVLIDDVVTTGSTLGACTEALVAGGAAGVRAATLAREV